MEGTPVDTDSEEEGPSVRADPVKMLHSITMLSETEADPKAIQLLLSSIFTKNANGTPDSPGRKRRSDTGDDRDKENKRNRQESQDTPNKTKRQSNEAGRSRDKVKNDQFKCYICNIVYKTEWRFASHLKSHPDLCGIVILRDEIRRFCCALCGNRYSNKANVKRHIHGNHKNINLKCDSKDSRESKSEKKDSKVNEEQEGTADNSQSNNEGSEDTAKERTEQSEVRNEQSCSQKKIPATVFCRECNTSIVHTKFKAHQERHKNDYGIFPYYSDSEIIEEVPQEQNNNEMCSVPNNAQEGVVSREEPTVDQTHNSQFNTTVEEGNQQSDQEEIYAAYDLNDGNHKITNLKIDSKDRRESKCEKKSSKVIEEKEGTAGKSQSNNEGSEDIAKEPTERPEVRNEQSCSRKKKPNILENRLLTVCCTECDTYILRTVFKAHQEHKIIFDKFPYDSDCEIIEEVPQEQNNNEMCNVANNAQEGVVSREESTVDQTHNSQFNTTVEEGNEQKDQEEIYTAYDLNDGNHKITNLKIDSKDRRESKCEKKASKVIEEKEGTAGKSQSNNEGSEDIAKEPTERPEVRNEQSCSRKKIPNILENRLLTVCCTECDTYILRTVFKAHQEQHKIDRDKVPHDSYSEIIEEVPQEQNNNEMCNVPDNAQEEVVSRDESTVDQTNNSQFSTFVEEGNEQGDQEETSAIYDVHTVSASGFDNHFSEDMKKELKKDLKKLISMMSYDNEVIEVSDDSDGEENITQPNSTSSLRNSTDLNDILKDGKDNNNAITDNIFAPANEANNEQHAKETTSNGNNDDSTKTDDTITPAKSAHEAINELPKEVRSNENNDDNAKIGDIFAPDNEGNNEEQPKAVNSKGNNDDHEKIDSIIAPAKETKNKEQLKEASSNKNSNGINSNGNGDDNIDNKKAHDTFITANERNIGQPDKSNSASNAILPSTSDLDIGEENEEGGQRNELQLLIEEERRIKDILSRRDDGM